MARRAGRSPSRRRRTRSPKPTSSSARLNEQHAEVEAEIDVAQRQRRRASRRTCWRSASGWRRPLGVAADALPFAGELIAGARGRARLGRRRRARCCTTSALSLLVPDDALPRAWPTGWTARICGRRLVYFRVRPPPATPALPDLHPRFAGAQARHATGIGVLRLAGARARAALRLRLLRRPRRSSAASARRHHPRRADQGRRAAATRRTTATASTTARRYVLGWTNERKIEALETQAGPIWSGVVRRLARTAVGEPQGAVQELRRPAAMLHQLEVYADFEELDWRPLALADRRSWTRSAAARSSIRHAARAATEQLAGRLDEPR